MSLKPLVEHYEVLSKAKSLELTNKFKDLSIPMHFSRNDEEDEKQKRDYINQNV